MGISQSVSAKSHLKTHFASSTANLTGKIEWHVNLIIKTHSIQLHQPLLVLVMRQKLEAINATEQN